MTNKELLKIFVSIVDTELLERIIVKVFETENVQDSDGRVRTSFRVENGRVYFAHNPDKHSTVDPFGEGISNISLNL